MAAPPEEPFLLHAHPRDRTPMASRVRGTVIVSSLRGLRSHGLGDRYLAALDRRHRDTIDSLTAASWLPIDFAMAHYDACDRLELGRSVIEDIGAQSGRFVNETVLNVLSRLSTEGGVTPWIVLANAQKLMSRTWTGSSIAVWKLGPKEARFELIQNPAARYPYFRTAFGAFVRSICALFARTVLVRELPQRTSDSEVSYRFSWV